MSKYDFFISYRRSVSVDVAKEIASSLRGSLQYSVFMDLDTLKNANDWKRKIDDSLPDSRAVIALMGLGSFGSPRDPDEFLYELKVASQNQMPVIPVDYRGFLGAREEEKIADEGVRRWLARPTAMNADSYLAGGQFNRSAFNLDVVERMKVFFPENYLGRMYYRQQCGRLQETAREYLANDGRIDPHEMADLVRIGTEAHLSQKTINKIIEDVMGAPARTIVSPLQAADSSPQPPARELSQHQSEAHAGRAMTARQLAMTLTPALGAETVNRVKASLGNKHMMGDLTAKDINNLLESLGLLEEALDGFALTEPGGVHGTETLARGADGEEIRTLRWRDSVLDALGKEISLRADAAAPAREIPVGVDTIAIPDAAATLERAARSARGRAKEVVAEAPTTEPSEDLDDLYQALAGFTAKRAKEAEAAGFIATVTGRSEAAVRRALSAAAPNTHVSNLFDEFYDFEVIGALTAKAATRCGVTGAIAEYLDLPRPDVKERLNAVHGRTAVATVFANEWEPDDEVRRLRRAKPVPMPAELKAETSSPTETGADDGGELWLLRAEVVAAAADGVIEMMEHHHLRRRAVFLGIADDEDEAIAVVTNIINEVAPGVRSEPDGAPVEGGEPHSDRGYDAIGALCARDVDDNMAWAIAELCGYEGTKGVRRRTNKSPDALVRDLFSERWDHADVLGALTVARARAYQIAAPLARLSGLPESEVRNRLDAVKHGRTLVRNVVFPMSQAPVSTPAGVDASTSFGRMVDSFIRSLPEAQRRAADWFLAATTNHGQTPKKPKDRRAIEIQEWTAKLVFSDAGVTFETGYDADDMTGELAHHVAAMRAIPGAERLLQGPGQPWEAPTYRVEIGDVEALDVARLVFEAFATASESDDQDAEGQPRKRSAN